MTKSCCRHGVKLAAFAIHTLGFHDMSKMKALVFIGPDRIELVDKPIPDVGPNDAQFRFTTTTI